jgi:hypothetical protein
VPTPAADAARLTVAVGGGAAKVFFHFFILGKLGIVNLLFR